MTPAAAAILAGAVRRGLLAKLKPTALRVYLALWAEHGPRELFVLDMRRVQELSDVSRRRAPEAIEQLYRAGLLVRHQADQPSLMLTDPAGGG